MTELFLSALVRLTRPERKRNKKRCLSENIWEGRKTVIIVIVLFEVVVVPFYTSLTFSKNNHGKKDFSRKTF